MSETAKRKPASVRRNHVAKLVVLTLFILAIIFLVFYLLITNPAR